MPKKKKAKTDKPVGVSVYEIDRYLPGKWGKGSIGKKDPLDEALELQTKDLVQRAKKVSIEAYIAKQEAEINKIQGGNPSSQEASALAKSLLTDPEVQKSWLSMDETSRNVLLSTAMTLKTQGGASQGALQNIMPYMMMTMRNNPQTSVKELLEIITVLRTNQPKGDSSVEMMKVLVPLIQANQGSKGGVAEILATVMTIFNQLAAKDQALSIERFRNLESRISSPIEFIKAFKADAEVLGLKSGNESMEMTKLKIDHDKWKFAETRKYDEWRDSKDLERQDKVRRDRILENSVNKTIEMAGPIINKIVGVGSGPTTVNPGSGTVTDMNSYDCTRCGTTIKFKGNPPSIKCPNSRCKMVFEQQTQIPQPPTPPPTEASTPPREDFTMVNP